jgi:hypothetical protein
VAIFLRVGLPYLALGIFALVLRPYIAHRRRRPARPAEPGTAGHRWRKIGAPG